MPKVRTTIALSQVSHQWLRERAPSTGEMAEYLDNLLQKERTLGPIESRMQRLVDMQEQGIDLAHSQDPDVYTKAQALALDLQKLMERFEKQAHEWLTS